LTLAADGLKGYVNHECRGARFQASSIFFALWIWLVLLINADLSFQILALGNFGA
jgi:hypothetical protein